MSSCTLINLVEMRLLDMLVAAQLILELLRAADFALSCPRLRLCQNGPSAAWARARRTRARFGR